ncbi:MAG TPA: hypothetical protein VKZ44_00050 [Taishania sp.]|nr:hypothetical protein [Taishania sp.]
MKALLLISGLLLSTISGTNNTDVYICVSPNAKKYHQTKNCSGLQRCTHEIRKVTLKEAKDRGYTNCLLEK